MKRLNQCINRFATRAVAMGLILVMLINMAMPSNLIVHASEKDTYASGKRTFEDEVIIDEIHIKVTAEEGVVPKGTKLYAKKLTNDKMTNTCKTLLTKEIEGEQRKKSREQTLNGAIIFDIKLLDKEGNELQPNKKKGDIAISFTMKSLVEESIKDITKTLSVFSFNEDVTDAFVVESTIDEKATSVMIQKEESSIYGVAMTSVEPLKNEMGSMVIKKGSETGETVADLVASDVPELIPGEEYYLCVTLDVPEKVTGLDNFVKIALGQKVGDGSYKANGLVATNIPGNTETPGEILHDGFSHLLTREECPHVAYGSNEKHDGTLNSYVMKDGVFSYQISDKKLAGDSIYFAMGFKLDPVYWSNVEKITEAISIDMGTVDAKRVITYTHEFSSDVTVAVSNKKEFYCSSSQKTVSFQLGKYASPISLTMKSDTNSPMLYESISYDVTYPKGAELKVSISSTNMETKVHSTIGTLRSSEGKDNGDGTITETVVVSDGYKGLDSRVISYLYLKFPEGKFQETDVKTLVVSNARIKFKSGNGGEESVGKSVTVTYKAASSSEAKEQVTLVENNRATNATTEMGNVYNWNIGRNPDELIATTSLLGSSIIKNSGSMATNNAKTYIAHFNTTNAQAVINFVTIPIGWQESKNDYIEDITVYWSGQDAKGNEVTGKTTISNASYRCKNTSTKKGSPYILLKASELGIVSFISVRANIGRLWEGFNTSSSSHSNRFNSQTSGVYGYFTSSNVGDVVVNAYELVNTEEDAQVNDLSCTSKAESTNDATMYMNNSLTISEQDSKIVAGDSVKIKEWELQPYYSVSAGTSAKPGTNTSILIDPVVILKLPKGITYSNLSFKKKVYSFYGNTSTNGISSESKADFEFENITYLNKTGDGTNLYKISFKDMILGSFDENGDFSYLLMDITFDTDRLVTTTTYDFGDLVHLTSENYMKTANYTSLNFSYAVEDTYRVNNGKDLSSGRAINANIKGIAVQRLAEITVSSAISATQIDGKDIPEEEREWLTYDISNPNSMIFLGLKSTGQYKVGVNNPSTAIGKDFSLFIPIPKRNEDLGEVLQNSPFEFDMALSIANLPEGFQAEFIRMEKMDSMNLDDVKYKKTDEASANAMLVTANEIGSGKYYELLFDFYVDSNTSFVDMGLTNIFRSGFQYTLEGMVKNSASSYVATEIASSTISGTVFEDVNLNGLLEAGLENGMADIMITARDTKGRVQTVQTDALGRYQLFQVREEKIILTMKVEEEVAYRFILNARKDIPPGTIGTMVTPGRGNQNASYTIPKASKEEVVNACVTQIQKLIYDRGTGAGQAPIGKEYRRGETVTVEAPSAGMYKNGYDFIGWSKEGPSAKGVDYIPGNTFIMDSNVTLYAVWVAKDLMITFDYNGGVAADPSFTSKVVTYGKAYKQKDSNGRVFPQDPTKEGWSFWKWEPVTVAEEGSGTKVSGDTRVNLVEDTTLRAVYTTLNKLSDSVTITCGTTVEEDKPFYDFNESIKAIHDAEVTASNKIEFYLMEGELPKGLTFSADYSKIYGTPLEMNGEGTDLLIGVKTRNGVIHTFKLRIKVKPILLTMVVSANPNAAAMLSGGKADINLMATIQGLDSRYPLAGEVAFSIVDSSNVRNPLANITISEDGMASTDWTAVKSGLYNIEALFNSDIGKMYQLQAIHPIEGYVVADAPLVNHQITFHANAADASIAITKKYVVEGEKYGSLPVPTRDGYEFVGWYTDPEDGKKITNTSSVSLGEKEGEQALYAHWKEKSYTVVYETNTTESLSNKAVGYHTGTLLPAEDLEKRGHTFKEWLIKGTEIVVTSDTVLKEVVENEGVRSITLSAVWTPNAYTVFYDGNGGSVSARSTRVLYGSSYGKMITPLRTGYEFVGWQDEKGNIVTGTTLFNFAHETALKAQWKVKEFYSVIFNSNGGTPFDRVNNIAWNANDLAGGKEPVREGYQFAGWKYGTTLVSDATTYGSLAVMETVTMITLVAQWEAVAVEVSFQLNSPTGELPDPMMPTLTVYYGSEYGTLPTPNIEGYLFVGWYTEAEGGSRVTPATMVTRTGGHVLYAQWKREFYHITHPSTMSGYTIVPLEGQQSSVKEHESYSFRLQIAEGYDMTKEFSVKVKKTGEEDKKATEIVPVDGVYSITDITDDVTLVVTGVDDITAPKLTISIGENKWDKFLSKVTFGLYSNKSQDITIEAEDSGSKVAGVEYLISTVPFEQKELMSGSLPWKVYERVVTITPEQECYIYAKAVDRRGNITYVNTDGIVLDSIAPVLNGITSGEVYYGSTRVTVEELHFNRLLVNGEEVLLDKSGSLILRPSDTPYVIKASDLIGNETEYEIMVRKAIPVIERVGAVTATYGMALKEVLPPAHKDGVFVWEQAGDTLVGDAGEQVFHVTFIPNDLAEYEQVNGIEISVIVEKAMPIVNPRITMPDVLFAKDSLSKVGISCLNEDTKGSIAWSDPKLLVSEGAADYEWIFRPDDAKNYYEIRGMQALTAIKAEGTMPPEVNPPEGTMPPEVNPPEATMPPEVNPPEATMPPKVSPPNATTLPGVMEEVSTPQEEVPRESGNIVITIKEEEDEEKKIATNFVSRDQVIDACLSDEEKQLVQNGSNAEIRLEVKMITSPLLEQDRVLIDKGIESFHQSQDKAVIDTYIDLQLWKRVSGNEWIRVTEAKQEVKVMMEVPKKLQSTDTRYFIIKTGNDSYVVEEDEDELDETITISTRYFTTCAIAHAKTIDNKDAVPKEAVGPWRTVAFCIGVLAIIMVLLYRRYLEKIIVRK